MYTMDNDKLPRKPLIKSNASATQELLDWVEVLKRLRPLARVGLLDRLGVASPGSRRAGR